MHPSCKVFTRDLNHHLTNLVRNLNQSDIQSTEALLQDFIGNSNAVKMFRWLVYWFPKAKKFGGWVYKSCTDWYNEQRLSRGQVNRVHSGGYLEAIGIERTLQQACGAPTNHYLLNPEKFLNSLAAFLSLTLQELYRLMEYDTPPVTSSAIPAPASQTETDLTSPPPWSKPDTPPLSRNNADTPQSLPQNNADTSVPLSQSKPDTPQSLPQNEAIETPPLHRSVQSTDSKQSNRLSQNEAIDPPETGQSITEYLQHKISTGNYDIDISGSYCFYKYLDMEDRNAAKAYRKAHQQKSEIKQKLKTAMMDKLSILGVSQQWLDHKIRGYGFEHVYTSYQKALDHENGCYELVKRFQNIMKDTYQPPKDEKRK
jgi:hypothetical protein